MGSWYIPSKQVRKAQSGHPCPGCSLLMHWGDMCAWSGGGGTVYIHTACAEILFDSAHEAVIHYAESAGDTETPPAEETEGVSDGRA